MVPKGDTLGIFGAVNKVAGPYETMVKLEVTVPPKLSSTGPNDV